MSHSDVDVLFIKNERLRWVIIDEVSMLADELLGDFEAYLSTAATKSRFRERRNNTTTQRRIFGGYNLMLFGDWWQLPPYQTVWL